MEEVLILLLQTLVEILVQVVGSGLLNAVWWGESRETPSSQGGWQAVLFLVAGGLVGWLTLLVVPHNLIPWSWLRLANLAIGPAGSAWASWRFARWRQRRDPDLEPRRHAWGSGMACLGVVLVRFIWGTR